MAEWSALFLFCLYLFLHRLSWTFGSCSNFFIYVWQKSGEDYHENVIRIERRKAVVESDGDNVTVAGSDNSNNQQQQQAGSDDTLPSSIGLGTTG